MKSFFAFILTAILTAALQAAPYKDAELSALQKAYIEGALPDKAYAKPEKTRKILVFSRTTSFRHRAGIPALKYALTRMGDKTGAWQTIVSDDLANFEPDKLKEFDCVVMNNTTGAPFAEELSEVAKMTPEQKAPIVARDKRLRGNLVDYVKNGGGLVVVHGGADAYSDKLGELAGPDYVQMVGAVFHSHPWCADNEPETFIVEDMDSPLTKGIWPHGEFIHQEEVYMFGSQYDRKNLRVLTGMDVGRSPITVERMKNSYIRPDGDIPVSWIKTFGNGRVFYGSLGHRRESYYSLEVLEHYLRGVQYACGDIKDVDVSSLPFVPRTKKTPAPMTVSRIYRTPLLFTRPSVKQIEALRQTPYGEMTEALNRLFFATGAYNADPLFCKEMAAFAVDELAAKQGTDRYRVLLADILENVGLQDKVAQAETVFNAEPDSPSATVLQNAIAHSTAKGIPFGFKMDDSPTVPETAPTDERALFNLIGVLQDNPSLEIPSYLKLEDLKGPCRVRMIYALAERGENLDKVLALEPADAAEALAIAWAATKGGNASSVAKVAQFAKRLKRQEQSVLASYIQKIPCDNRAQVMVEALLQAEGPQLNVLVEALSGIDAQAALAQIYQGLYSPEISIRRATIRILAGMLDKPAFLKLAEALAAEQDVSLRAQMLGVMSKIAALEFDKEMLEAVIGLYEGASLKDRVYLLRFAPILSNDRAFQWCRQALETPDLRAAAIAQFGKWKNAQALALLLELARSTQSPDERALLLEAAVDYCQKGNITQEALSAVFQYGSPELKQRMADAAAEVADMEWAQLLDDAGYPAQAERMRQAVKQLHLTAKASHNPGVASAMLDGKIDTRWTSRTPAAPDMWIQFDMGAVRIVREIALSIAGAPTDTPEGVVVLAGREENALTPVDCRYKIEDNTVRLVFISPVTARFVRILSLSGAVKAGQWWSVFEASVK